ncbi:uncharacterized protein LOC121644200 isoform X2 [Melanotaenia boesemani]|uniref:uncharacterized protein LOC121644200 isoform X2 n=1 Tax=Melanotaenia boesemani TaxID=1250792 RepID=UPI001C03C0DC|nr:uncharacterized protein LOC121644200 isoform X2 [Melanotaenia boesemani]
MGNMHCPAEDSARLAAVARVICPFPNYTPHPHFANMLSVNSSHHLKEHYTAVQSSLTSKQLEDFTQGLRTTFGREGKVTLGGVGVVALSLAVLFDTLAKTVKGELVSDSEPIPGLFVKDPRGYYPPQVYTISKYLRLVPHIANNPTRMKEETERCIKHLDADTQALDQLGENYSTPLHEDITKINFILGYYVTHSLFIHLGRINNGTEVDLDRFQQAEVHKKGDTILNVNCDPEIADTEFLAEVEKSDDYTKESLQKCKPKNIFGIELRDPKSWLLHVAEMEFTKAIFFHFDALKFTSIGDLLTQREDFDLRRNALGKWE